MEPTAEERQFVLASISNGRSLGKWCDNLQRKAEEAVILGVLPREVGGETVHAKTYVCGALLLTMCGLLAEDDEDKQAMRQAAKLLRPINLAADSQFSEEIREAFDEILTTFGAKKTRHLWN